MNSDTETELAKQLRAQDYERFLCIQLAPRVLRVQLYAVTAFHAELARIAELVREPLLGHIRLAWWREAVEEMMAGRPPRHHPVLQALVPVFTHSSQIAGDLLRMVEARAADLDPTLLTDQSQWQAYLDATAGVLHRAWALILDPEGAEEQAATIAHAAQAYATIDLVRAIPSLAARGQSRFAQSMLQDAGLDSLAPSPQLNEFVAGLMAHADEALNAKKPKKYLRPLDALSSLAHLHGRAIRHTGYDPYRIASPKLSLVWRVIQMKFFLC